MGVIQAATRLDGTVEVTMAGDVDLYTVKVRSPEVLAGVGADTHVVSELSAVDFMDSAAIALLVRLRNVAASFTITAASPRAVKVLTMTGLSDVFGLDAI